MKSVILALCAWAFALVLLQPARADESAALFFLQDQARHQAAPQLHEAIYNTGRVIARGFKNRAVHFGGDVAQSGSSLISEASRYIGQGNFTRTGRAWCADAVNAWLARTGHRGTGSGAAISFARYGAPTAPRVGAIAVMPHHVGIVVGFKGGNPVLLSGNHGHRVGVGTYAARKIIAYRAPV